MELDRTRIAIRERSLLEIFDLALHVICSYGGPLLVATLAGVLPLALFNGVVLHRIVAYELSSDTIIRYLTLMIALVFIEAPVASLPATRYLGWTMFYEPAGARSTLRELWRLAPRLFWCLGIMRGVVPAMLLAIWINPLDFGMPDFFIILIALLAVPLRAFRPYISEVVLLERNPLRSRDPQTLTISRRSAALHTPSAGDLFVRWLSSALLAVLMTLALICTVHYVAGMLTYNWTWGHFMYEVMIPASLWLVASLIATVRFLSYLDLRIRREGWEVELTVRAAATQLRRHMG